MAKVIIMPLAGNNENFKIKIIGKFGNKFIVKPKVYEVIQENNDTTVKLVNTFDKTILLSGYQVADFEIEGNTFTNIEDLTQAISIAVFKKGGGGDAEDLTQALSLKQDKTDNTLNTTDKTVVGAINELNNSKQNNLVAGVNIKTINNTSLLGSGNLNLIGSKNEAGQVKVNYTGLSLINFATNVEKEFDIGSAVPTIATSPTTTYPFSTPNNYSGIFDSSRNGGTSAFAGRLIENPKQGQAHVWRIIGTYSNKPSGNIGELVISLRNPVSGFNTSSIITFPGGKITGPFSVLLYTIADSESITPPNGYILTAQISFADTDLNITINSITRFSNAIDN